MTPVTGPSLLKPCNLLPTGFCDRGYPDMLSAAFSSEPDQSFSSSSIKAASAAGWLTFALDDRSRTVALFSLTSSRKRAAPVGKRVRRP